LAAASGTTSLPGGGAPAFDGSAGPRGRLESVDFEDDDEEEVLEVEPEPVGDDELPRNGFHAFLRHANLHNLLQIESMSRTTGVFLIVSGGSRGYLHLIDGELVHAETGRQIGEAAAAEILAWENGEFKSCSRTLAPVRTVHSSLQNLLLRLAQASDEAQAAQHHQSSRVVRRPLDQEAPTETALPAVASSPGGSASPGSSNGVPRPKSRAPDAGPPNTTASPSERPPADASLAGTPRAPSLAGTPRAPSLAGTPRAPSLAGTPRAPSVTASRSSSPPPLPPPEPTSVADVVLSAAGEVIQGRGAATEELAARVAYAARLADLIGRAIRSGTPRALELRGKSTQTVVSWQADGNLSASLDLPVPTRR
jgi:hypothetical protein